MQDCCCAGAAAAILLVAAAVCGAGSLAGLLHDCHPAQEAFKGAAHEQEPLVLTKKN
jgi:hypothetical protein